MAPKRSAPPQQQPPPPVASSEETASGSGSDESEEEEEIAHLPPPAAPKAPPPQKGQESETDDEDEVDEEEDEGEHEKTNHATPPAVPKNPPPPPNREESETEEEEEEEETDDEAPQSKPAPKREAEGKGAKPSSSSEDKKPGALFQRTWSTEDEVRILEALAAHRREHGMLPQPDALVAALAGSLDNNGYGRTELQGKVSSLKRRYSIAAKKGELPSKDRDRRLFDLSKHVWGGDKPAKDGARREAPREFSEMCELYPYLAEEVKALEASHPGLFKREFAMIHDDKALALDVKIKKQRLVQMKVELRRYDLTKEVTRALMELAE
ncbi:probable transcription factor At1g61730 [Phragmites australis]|uniref:probable transcription factor At1g61730 n=1 Tax=Phragmites australis TaxID=29695 RepID=UPI002D78182F|nr:probable transcription factor At1g61730 [Phragmites australis]